MSTDARPITPLAAAAGIVAVGAGLGIGELFAGLSRDISSPIISVGDAVIRFVPTPIKELAIEWFGTNDKLVLLISIGVVLLAVAAGVGVLARRSLPLGLVGVALFGLLGAAAATSSPVAGLVAALPAVVGALVAGVVLWLLVDVAFARSPDGDGRRWFLSGLAGAAAVGVGAAVLGRLLRGRFDVAEAREDLALPEPARRLDLPAPSGVHPDVEGLHPFFTANEDFYRIDTALSVPQIDPDRHVVSVTGMVDSPLQIPFVDLLQREMIEIPITMTCVSNEVGGELVDTARWLGTRLADLLDEAGVADGATQIVGRSVDGYTCGFPVEAAYDRDALVAVGMNGEPLPPEHGFPVRLVTPGLYGYVSATKWLAEIELTTFEDFTQYWVPRGYAARAPIKTQSQIDVPKPLAQLDAGMQMIAGVAWAQTRGIERVEVRIDEGEWQQAQLAPPVNDVTWRQWTLPWEATSGRHTLRVRATDATGETQTQERSRPLPDGATGWHSVVVLVS